MTNINVQYCHSLHNKGQNILDDYSEDGNGDGVVDGGDN
jgi:hypothetical protein